MNKLDPYFKKPPEPSRPLISTASVVCCCLTAAFCFFVYALPDQAGPIIAGVAGLLGFLIFVMALNHVL